MVKRRSGAQAFGATSCLLLLLIAPLLPTLPGDSGQSELSWIGRGPDVADDDLHGAGLVEQKPGPSGSVAQLADRSARPVHAPNPRVGRPRQAELAVAPVRPPPDR